MTMNDLTQARNYESWSLRGFFYIYLPAVEEQGINTGIERAKDVRL